MALTKLKKTREEKGLTAKEVYITLDVSQSTYSRYEVGTRKPSIKTLKRIATLFKCTVDELI
ncbi:helix-turn-helix protein [Clostridium saccharobutylicum]|uniref:helix-turn-helix domain-containing protein n=1 Tax=Clostridium saccharobutylicum TaxID=169679 RepID=UPI00098BEFF2|nr:helix-turn-helix transcriptional regulator [Clostridium saccharobutylicum]OOM17243.1 helix-turn-helix protein [Clostridium saccharobutylicum]